MLAGNPFGIIKRQRPGMHRQDFFHVQHLLRSLSRIHADRDAARLRKNSERTANKQKRSRTKANSFHARPP